MAPLPSRRGFAFARADVFATPAGVFFRRKLIDLAFLGRRAGLVELLEERDAPTASGASAAALRELARGLGRRLPHEVDDLSSAHVEAITNLRVEVHELILAETTRRRDFTSMLLGHTPRTQKGQRGS